MKIALLGMSKLGQSLYQFYNLKKKIPTKINIDTCLDTDIIFICVKTIYSYLFKQLDKSEILKICSKLSLKFIFKILIYIYFSFIYTTVYSQCIQKKSSLNLEDK